MKNGSELQRLQVLHDYDIMDTLPEAQYDGISLIAKQITACPISFISFIDGKRQWYKSKVGFEFSEVSRDLAFCNYLIEYPEEDKLIVPDATTDERFKTNPLTQLETPLVFCASIPLKSPEGFVLGTLCVIDHKPKQISKEQIQSLRFLAGCVTDKLNLQRERRIEEKSADEQALLRNAIHASSDHLFIIDPETMRFVGYNQTAISALGYSKAEMLRMGPHDIKPLYTKEELREQYYTIINAPERFGVIETIHKKKNGELMEVQVQLTTFKQRNQKVLLIASARDVTAQNQVQKTLAESEKKYRDLFTYLPNVVIRTSTSGIIEMVSSACLGLLGYTANELIDTHIGALYTDTQDTQKFIAQLHTAGFVKNFRVRFTCKDGSVKHISINAQFHYNDDAAPDGIEGVITDITELIETKNSIRATKDFYEDILNSVGADIAVFDEQNRYLFLNRHAIKDDGLRTWMIGKTNTEYCRHRNKPLAFAALREEQLVKAEKTGKKQESLEEINDAAGDKQFMLRVVEPFITKENKRFKVGYGFNVTGLKNTEIKLAQSERYASSILNAMPDLMLRMDAEGRYIDLKTHQYNMLVAKPECMMGKTMHELLPKELADFHLDMIRKTLSLDTTFSYEYELPVITGAVRSFEARLNKLSENEVVIITRDITERKNNELKIISYAAQLKEREENLARLIQRAPDGVIVLDKKGNIQLWNPMCEKIFGWKDEEVTGEKMSDIIVPEGLRWAHDKGMQRFIETGESRLLNKTLELTALNKWGETFFIELTISAAQQNGDLLFIAFLRDISEKKKAQDALEKRERQLNEAQETAKLASYEINPETNTIEWSASVYTILNIPAVDKINSIDAFYKYIHPADIDHITKIRRDLEQAQQPASFEFRIVTPDGAVKHMLVKRRKMVTGNAKRIFGTLQDITEEKLLEQKILEAIIETEEKERTRIAQELHDGVCQDIAAAQLTLEMARQMMHSDASLATELFGKSKEGLLHALEHTRKVSHELLPKDLKETGLTQSIDNLIQQLNVIHPANYSLEIKGEAKEPEPLVSVNLYRIAQEFIRNSQKHSGAKNISVLLYFKEQQLDVELKDDGKGFDAVKVQKNGIGFLNMSKRIDTIGGKLSWESAIGQGVKLNLTVPL